MPEPTEQPAETGHQVAHRRREVDKYKVSQLSDDQVTEILDLLERGVPLTRIARDHGCSTHTIQAIAERHADRLPSWQERQVKTLESTIDQLSADLQERVSEIKASALPVSLAILLDKRHMLTGQPTHHIHHSTNKLQHGQVIDIVASLPSVPPPPGPQESGIPPGAHHNMLCSGGPDNMPEGDASAQAAEGEGDARIEQ
jgi:transposase-like protein